MKGTFLVYLFLLVTISDAANILGVFLVFGYSHMIVFSTIINELARKGHNITIITVENFPVHAGNHFRQIDLSDEIEPISQRLKGTYPPKEYDIAQVTEMIGNIHEVMFNSTEVRTLLDPTSGTKFDIILVEFWALITPVFKEVFKAPMISIANVNLPEMYMNFVTGQLKHDQPAKTFQERMMTWAHHLQQYAIMTGMSWIIEKEIQKHLPEVKRSYQDLLADLDLVFFVEIPGLEPPRALPRYHIPLGPIHINDSVSLEQDIEEYLNKSSQGLVYVSFGSQVYYHNLPTERQQQFFDAFENLPYNIILKCGKCDDVKVPTNVKIVKWVDQFAVLSHPNTKAFVTHGGFQSLLEAVYRSVPVVAFPCFNDQHTNAALIEKTQMGLQLDLVTFQSIDLQKAILAVIEEKHYKENMVESSIAMREKPMKGVDVIAFWVDYLAKHGHVKFLHGDTRHMPFLQYFNLDIILFHALIIGAITYSIMRRCCEL